MRVAENQRVDPANFQRIKIFLDDHAGEQLVPHPSSVQRHQQWTGCPKNPGVRSSLQNHCWKHPAIDGCAIGHDTDSQRPGLSDGNVHRRCDGVENRYRKSRLQAPYCHACCGVAGREQPTGRLAAAATSTFSRVKRDTVSALFEPSRGPGGVSQVKHIVTRQLCRRIP